MGAEMGLLDSLLGSSFDDPKTAAAMQLAQGLLSAPRAMQGLSGGLLGYQQTIAAAKQAKQLEEARALQMQQHQLALEQAKAEAAKRQAIEQAYRNAMRTPQQLAMAANGGPTNAAAQAIPSTAPGFDQAALIQGLTQADPQTAYQMLQPKPRKLTSVAPGATLVDEADPSKPVFTAPAKDDSPSAVKEYQFAKSQGYPGTFQQFQIEQKKAGATNLSVSMDKGFGTTFADNAAKDLGASRDKARAAANTINTLNSIDGILDSGKVATGPTQPFQMFGMQMAQTLGIGGKDNAEKLANTRHLITNAANLALDGAARMAGQGQITEAERALIKDAAAGNIDRLTPPEIKMLTGALRKVNAAVIASHQSLLKNVGPQFEQFKPFYNVDIPSAPSGSGEWGIRPVGG